MASPLDALDGVTNAVEALPGLYTGGQPGRRHFEALRDAGLRTVLDLRAPGELRWLDEPALLERLGMAYHNIPVGPATLTDATLDLVREALRTPPEGGLLVHCVSGNRVGGALLPAFVLDRGLPLDDAIALAGRVGLVSPDLLEWAVDYVRRQPAG